MDHEIKSAIENHKLIEVEYKGLHRTLEPHCYGISRKGKQSLLAYQIKGHSASGEMPGWKFLDLNLTHDIRVLAKNFSKPRPEYHHDDKRFKKVFAEV